MNNLHLYVDEYSHVFLTGARGQCSTPAKKTRFSMLIFKAGCHSQCNTTLLTVFLPIWPYA